MIVIDWIFLGIILGGLFLGALFGFGGIFKFFTTGIFGIIISIVVCLLVGTAFYGPCEPLLNKISDAILANENWFCQFIGKLNIQNILYYVIMFVIVWILRLIIVRIIKSISQSENKVIKIMNRIMGSVFLLAILLVLFFCVLFVIGWVGGESADNFSAYLASGALRLDRLFEFLRPSEEAEAVASVLKSVY
ncbi:MAG: hypothetical protein K2O89_04950 [Clostridia bacterium]|nr:hypothetical protein [Clostridia bacterium]